MRIYNREYRRGKEEYLRAQQAEYRLRNIEQCRAAEREYSARNRESRRMAQARRGSRSEWLNAGYKGVRGYWSKEEDAILIANLDRPLVETAFQLGRKVNSVRKRRHTLRLKGVIT